MLPSYPPRPVMVVLGMHRSGTSLCAHLLHALGVDMADTPGASPDNAKGHWERPRINDLNDQIFGFFDRAWSGPSHILAMPEHWLGDPRVQAVRRALAAVLAPGLAGSGPYGFKDPRTARLLPCGGRFSPIPAPNRASCSVFATLRKSHAPITARDKMAREHAEYRWLLYNAEAIAHLGDSEICLVPYEHWFTQPDTTIRRVAAFAGVPAPPAELAATIVDAGLRHDDRGAPPAGKLARRLYHMICDGIQESKSDQRFSEETRSFCGHIGEFEQLVQPLLVDREILRAGIGEQNRVIRDLNAVISELRYRAA